MGLFEDTWVGFERKTMCLAARIMTFGRLFTHGNVFIRLAYNICWFSQCRVAHAVVRQPSSPRILHAGFLLSLIRYVPKPFVLEWCEVKLHRETHD